LLRQASLGYVGLMGAGLFWVQPFLTATSLDLAAKICVVAWAVTFPLLAALVLLNAQRGLPAPPERFTAGQPREVDRTDGGVRRPRRRVLAHLVARRRDHGRCCPHCGGGSLGGVRPPRGSPAPPRVRTGRRQAARRSVAGRPHRERPKRASRRPARPRRPFDGTTGVTDVPGRGAATPASTRVRMSTRPPRHLRGGSLPRRRRPVARSTAALHQRVMPTVEQPEEPTMRVYPPDKVITATDTPQRVDARRSGAARRSRSRRTATDGSDRHA
jgi:hypothetical protein